MVYMSIVLTLSFSVYALSSLASLARFGLLIGFTIVVGSVLEVLVTPAVLLALPGLLGRRAPQRRPTEVYSAP